MMNNCTIYNYNYIQGKTRKIRQLSNKQINYYYFQFVIKIILLRIKMIALQELKVQTFKLNC